MKIYLDENHKYRDETGEYYKSVSEVIWTYKKPFDKHNISKAIARRDGRNQDEILLEWQEKADIAIATGNYVHDILERCLKNPEKAKNTLIHYEVQKIHHLLPEGVWIQERILADNEVAGTPDLLIKKENVIDIYDFKTNNLEDKYYNNFLPPFDHLPQTKLNEYRLQLSWYKKLVEYQGYNVGALKLINIYNGDVEVIELQEEKIQ